MVLLPSLLANKLKLFKFLLLHQLVKLEKILFHTLLVKSHLDKLMVLSVLLLLLMLQNVKTLSKFMLLGEIKQMLIFWFKNLLETLFQVKIE